MAACSRGRIHQDVISAYRPGLFRGFLAFLVFLDDAEYLGLNRIGPYDSGKRRNDFAARGGRSCLGLFFLASIVIESAGVLTWTLSGAQCVELPGMFCGCR